MTPDHTSRELLELLRRPAPGRAAETEADAAYEAWRAAPCVDAYLAFLAAEDRARDLVTA